MLIGDELARAQLKRDMFQEENEIFKHIEHLRSFAEHIERLERESRRAYQIAVQRKKMRDKGYKNYPKPDPRDLIK